MKKISLFVFAGLAAIACTKSPVDLEIHTSPIQEEPEVVKKGRTANIVMYADVDREVETRVSATEESGIINFEFDEGDEISAFFKSDECVDKNVKFTYNGSKFVTDEGQSYTTLDGDEMPEVYAIYPYDKGLGSVTDLGKVPVTIPQVQMYGSYTSNPYFPKQFARFMAVPSALKKKDGSYSIETKFYPMGSMVKLQVQNATETPLNIKSVNIYGPDNLSGDFTVDVTKNPAYNSEAEFTLTPDDGGVQYNHVCVSYGSEGKVLNNEGRLTIYAFVNAVAFEDGKGFGITVSTENGTYIADFAGGQRTYGEFARNRRDTYTITLDDNNRKVSEAVARYTDNDGAWQTASSLSDAISNVSSGGIVELLQNAAHGTSAAIILTGKTFTLNGNGHTYDVSGRTSNVFSHSEATSATDVTFRNIKFKSTETAENPNGKRLIQNQKTNSTITLAEGTEIEGIFYRGTGGGIVYNNGTININGAKVKNCGVIKDGTNGGNGGFIYSVSSKNSTAKVNFNSGEISNCTSAGSGGVFYIGAVTDGNSPELNVSGGKISNCSAGASGGVFYNATNAKMNFYDGNILDCSATNYGGVFYNYTNSELNVYGGCVTNCTSGSNGSLIYVSNVSAASGATVNLYGGEFICTGGYAAIYGKTGEAKITIGRENDPSRCPIIRSTERGIYSYGITKVYGGEITTTGVAVYSLSGSDGNASLNIYGGSFNSSNNVVYVKNSTDYTVNAEISGGKFKYTGKSETANVVYNSGATLIVNGGYFSREVKSDYLKKADEIAGTRAYKNYPNDEYEGYPYKVEEQHAAIFVNGSERTPEATIEDAIDAANASGVGACEIILTEDCTIGDASKNVINSNGVTLDLNGKTLIQNGSNRLGLGGSGHLIITDSKTGGTVTQKESGKNVFNVSSGILDIQGGTIIQYDEGTSYSIFIGGATLNVSEKACIVGNRSYALNLSKGTVNISGGEITSTANHSIYAENSSGTLEVTVKGGKIVTNVASKYSVYVKELTENSKLIINGGDFRSNYRCLYSATAKGRIEISPINDIPEPHFYSYDDSGSTELKLRLFSTTTGCVTPLCGCGYYGCASSNATWGIGVYDVMENKQLYSNSSYYEYDDLKYYYQIADKK